MGSDAELAKATGASSFTSAFTDSPGSRPFNDRPFLALPLSHPPLSGLTGRKGVGGSSGETKLALLTTLTSATHAGW